jgi:hypothetical protein
MYVRTLKDHERLAVDSQSRKPFKVTSRSLSKTEDPFDQAYRFPNLGPGGRNMRLEAMTRQPQVSDGPDIMKRSVDFGATAATTTIPNNYSINNNTSPDRRSGSPSAKITSRTESQLVAPLRSKIAPKKSYPTDSSSLVGSPEAYNPLATTFQVPNLKFCSIYCSAFLLPLFASFDASASDALLLLLVLCSRTAALLLLSLHCLFMLLLLLLFLLRVILCYCCCCLCYCYWCCE